jgi:hypothetical protein
MTSIDNADMYGNLTRVAMAKMVANYVLDLGLQELDTDKECNFPDVSASLDEAYDNGVTKACQLGLMGVGIEKFNPNGIVTRAEFGTVLSRALWGDEYNGADPYYKDHLQALKDEGIMNIIDNPNMKEVRGYVMLMMMRADDAYTPTTGCSAEELLACILADDYESCIAACSGTEDIVVKSGDLAVTAKESAGASAIIGADSELDFLTFKASERITLNKVTLERYGYSASTDVVEVWLEDENGDEVTNRRSLNNKDQVTLTLKKDYRDMKDANFVTVVSLDANASGSTIGFKVTDVESSAKNLNVTKYTPATYKMVTYTGTQVTLDSKGQNRTYYYVAGESYEVGRVQVKTQNSDVDVNGFTLTNVNAGLDLKKYVSKVEVVRDGKALANQSWSIDRDGEVKVNFTKDTIEAKKNAIYVINMEFEDLDVFGQKVALSVSHQGGINAVEVKTNARVSLTNSDALALKEYTFNGDKITLAKGKLDKTVYAKGGNTEVVVAEGTIALNEAIKLNTFYLDARDGTNQYTGVEAMRVIVAGDEYEGKKVATGFKFDNVVIEKAGEFKVLVDLDDDALNATVKFAPSSISKVLFDDGTNVGVYDEYRSQTVTNSSMVGSIEFATLRLEEVKGALDNNLTKTVEIKAEETSERVVLFDGEYTAKRSNVSLTEYTVSYASALTGDAHVTFFLTIDGKEVAPAYMDKDTEAGTGVTEYFDVVELEKDAKVKVKLEAAANLYENNYTFELTLDGENEDGDPAGFAKESAVELKVVSDGSVIVTEKKNVHLRNTVLKSATNTELARFIVKGAENSSIGELTKLQFTFMSGGTDITSSFSDKVSIRIDGATVDYSDLSDLDYDITGDGVEVLVQFKDGTNKLAAADYKTTVTVNGSKTRDYNRKVVPALVSIKSQTNSSSKSDTTYVFAIDAAESDYEIRNLEVSVGGTPIITRGSIDDLDDAVVANDDKVQFIDEIKYDVYDGNNTQVGNTITIARGTYYDYFKVGNDMAKIFSNK